MSYQGLWLHSRLGTGLRVILNCLCHIIFTRSSVIIHYIDVTIDKILIMRYPSRNDYDPDNQLDLGIFNSIFIIGLVSNIGDTGPLRRYALSECSCYTMGLCQCIFSLEAQLRKRYVQLAILCPVM